MAILKLKIVSAIDPISTSLDAGQRAALTALSREEIIELIEGIPNEIFAQQERFRKCAP